MSWVSGWIAACALAAAAPDVSTVRVPISKQREVDVSEVVSRLGAATDVAITRPAGELSLPIVGLAGSLARSMLAENLGPRWP